MSERLYILDAFSLIYQVFHAIDEMTSPSGMPTNAVFGFVRDIQIVLKDKKPTYFVCAFDASGDTFRHGLEPTYKATRAEMPDDLRPQFGMIRKILEAYKIPVLEQVGFEADDFLATVAFEAQKRGIQTFLCTADKDVRQCITDLTSVLDLRRNRIIDAQYLLEDWGIRPDQVVDYQSMVGDSVDNIRGIPGVGAKTATKLLNQFGTIEGILEHIDEVSGKKMKENILKGKASAIQARELVRLCTDVPIEQDWTSWKVQTPDYTKLLALFAECGFHRLAEEVRKDAPNQESWKAEYVLVRDQASLDACLAEIKQSRRLSIDLETTSIRATDAEIVGYAICAKPGKAFYVAVRGPEGQTSLDPQAVLMQLKPIFEDPRIEKIGQNLKYDITVLRIHGVVVANIAFDTLIASYLLEPGERIHNLDDLARRYLQHENIKITELIGPSGKSQLRMDQVAVEKVAQYAGEDADVAYRLTEILEPKLKEQELAKLFAELECPLVEVLSEMECNGIQVDRARLSSLASEFAERLTKIETEIYQVAGRKFNLNSPTQLRKVLFEELNLPVIKRTQSGPSTDQEVLEELADRHPICAMMIEHRKLTKLKGTYVDALPELTHPKTGRIHASFNQAVAATGRLSSSDPNLQNIPVRGEDGKQIRQAFVVPDDNHLLLSCDYSQIELRLLAHFSRDPGLCRAFQENQDIHAIVAAQIEQIALDDVTEDMRRKAKAVNFGIMYGLSPFGLARQLKIEQDEAAEFIEGYFSRYSGVEKFFTDVLVFAQKKGYVATMLGRRRPINGIKSTTGRFKNLPERTAINAVIQGSAADMIKRAMVNIHRRLKSEGVPARMLLQIHDELVFEVERTHIESVAALVVDEMTNAMPLHDVPVMVDAGVGKNWLDLEPLELELIPA